MKSNHSQMETAAYGGKNWSPRVQTHRDEIGFIWTRSGINSEWATLKSVLLHKPGPEIRSIKEPESSQMLDKLDYYLTRSQHENITQAFIDQGIKVHYVQPDQTPTPNLMFCADLVFMTPEGAILGRPASSVRAGEERWIARKLADLGIPILRTLNNLATFEGADALWLDPKTVLIGVGLRTNVEAVSLIQEVLKTMAVEVIAIDLPVGTMHLMGILRFLNHNIALTWPYRLAWKAQRALIERGYQVLYIPDETESTKSGALNFVTLKPMEILMAAGNPTTQEFLEGIGVKCHAVKIDELQKAAGGIGCLTAILEREILK